MNTVTTKPKNAKDFLESLGLVLDERTRKGIRFEFKQNNLEIDGFRFASEIESKRYIELKLEAMRGNIQNLIVASSAGVNYKLSTGATYQPTFLYFSRTGRLILEDVKPVQTSANLARIKHMKDQFDIEVRIIR